MKLVLACLLLLVLSSLLAQTKQQILLQKIHQNVKQGQQFMAGSAKVDATLPIGVPLAGYNHGDRRVKNWPLPKITNYTVFMNPSKGANMPLWVKCLALESGNEKFAVASIDAIGADGGLLDLALNISSQQGLTIPRTNVILSASHSHSGPGGLSKELFWSLAPATDVARDSLRIQMAGDIAACLVSAEYNMRPAKLGLGITELTTATRNRRAGHSPYCKPDSIDPQLSVFRVDDMHDRPLVTLWNFAIHGTCYGEDNMNMDGDIMGLANILIEKSVGGISMFVNSDAGDIAPVGCDPRPDMKGSHEIANAVSALRPTITTTTNVDFKVFSQVVDFGNAHLNLTLKRLSNCTSGGILDICTFCSAKYLNCDADLRVGHDWLENTPRFTGIRMNIDGKNTGIVTIPGEALHALGAQIRLDAKALGYENSLIFGYSNNHMGYFATAEEYEVGGYEGFMTFWGIGTADKVRTCARNVLTEVKP